MISVVIPTVDGREDHLTRCIDAYNANTINDFELIIIENLNSCGLAWNDGVSKSNGEYIHLTADDLEPHLAWDVFAIEAAEKNVYPAPLIFDYGHWPDRRTFENIDKPDWADVSMSTIPFFKSKIWNLLGPSLTCHYFTDDWLSDKANLLKMKIQKRQGYNFNHYFAQSKRIDFPNNADREEYDRNKQVLNEIFFNDRI